MKKHANIPIFIPHSGCPHDCIFCNQKIITARTKSPSVAEAAALIERNLATIRQNNIENIGIAFFGGSFTGIPVSLQTCYLALAKKYKDAGLVRTIRLSTRPDYISAEILKFLKKWSVDIIELGVQSFDGQVLALSERGHNAAAIYQSAALIKEYGFSLGIQLMIGLPGDSREKVIFSAAETVKLAADCARLYPVVVLKDTKLHQMYESDAYTPFSEEQMLSITKDAYLTLDRAGIDILRVGLKSTDIVNTSSKSLSGSYHPAFRQLVESEIAREKMSAKLSSLLGESQTPDPQPPLHVEFACHPAQISTMIGQKGANRLYFQKKYPRIRFSFRGDDSLDANDLSCRLLT